MGGWDGGLGRGDGNGSCYEEKLRRETGKGGWVGRLGKGFGEGRLGREAGLGDCEGFGEWRLGRKAGKVEKRNGGKLGRLGRLGKSWQVAYDRRSQYAE